MIIEIPVNNSITDSRSKQAPSLVNPSMAVFGHPGVYVSSKKLYYSYYNSIPSALNICPLDYTKVAGLIEQKYAHLILAKHEYKRNTPYGNSREFVNTIYILGDDILVDVEDMGSSTILCKDLSAELVKQLEKDMMSCKIRRSRSGLIHMVVQGEFGMNLHPLKLDKPNLSIALNYNDDFEAVHNLIFNCLSKGNKSGVVLLHGKPGTGKSTYLRMLISKLKKKIIFMPVRIAAGMDTPSLMSLLIDNKDSILIIEDAEELIVSRERSGESNIAILLNLTDGIPGAALGIQVICTFNTQLDNIDKALLRKGRLIAMYEFDRLTEDKTLKLMNHIGHTVNLRQQKMTLAEIYNYEGKDFLPPEKAQVGFVKSDSGE
ncbi:MAG: AAA family ATPase [Bacteroidetes bacterium]|nr:MAG: AAA family ATPase [Bacteroidota bacterium]REK00965.1 MAG: AAA family ATPase [Bacteroidota bacterium]REK34568.1 MAG: AAA family ATPase [Bacteroidota bacterium]REK51827.1 MAG: AAA family ATPase [Bacteroidota bacterium]